MGNIGNEDKSLWLYKVDAAYQAVSLVAFMQTQKTSLYLSSFWYLVKKYN